MVKESVAKAIQDFEAASYGYVVRSTLIDLLETINSLGGDTQKLGGLTQREYTLESYITDVEKDVDMMLLYDKEPTKENDVGSLKVIRNCDLTAFFNNYIHALQDINNNKAKSATVSDIGDNIGDCLVKLKNTLADIKEAINEKKTGPDSEVQDTDSVMDYATRLANIQMTNLKVIPYTATVQDFEMESDIVRDEESGVILSGHAYNPVTVNVQLKGYNATYDSNGTKEPPTGYDGFSSVTVEVPVSSSGSSSASGSGGSSGSVASEDQLNLSETTITSNGEYAASSYGVDGFSHVVVNVEDYEIAEGKTFTVTFVSEGEELHKAENVEPGSYVAYPANKELPKKKDNEEFYYFAGWEPSPHKVVSDMVCEATFGNWNPNAGSPTKQQYRYIQDSWEDICSHTVNPEIGDVKVIRIGNKQVIRMMKVYKTEDSATSVWISLDSFVSPVALTTTPIDIVGHWDCGNNYETRITDYYTNNSVREYLNTTFFNSLPQVLKDSIVYMDKAVPLHIVSEDGTGFYKPTNWDSNHSGEHANYISGIGYMHNENGGDRIWVPSMYELNLVDTKNKGDVCDTNTGNTYGVYWPESARVPAIYQMSTYQFFGKQYKDRFKHFGETTPYAQRLHELYLDSQYSSIPYDFAIRHMLPHIKMNFEYEGQTYTDWDALNLLQQYSITGQECNLDNYKILVENQGYLPTSYSYGASMGGSGRPYSKSYGYYTRGDFRSGNMATGIMLRDIRTSRGINNNVAFAGLDQYGWMSSRVTLNSTPAIIFGFGLK